MKGCNVMERKILVTGGAGYIGSHTCLALLNAGYSVVIADNLMNSKREAIKRVEDLSGKQIPFYCIDVGDETVLNRVFEEHAIDAVIHFAGLKAVGESVQMPTRYYRNNLDATLSVLRCMEQYQVRVLVFSSSATVYREPESPVAETAPLGCTNPYGWTKHMSEQMITDYARSNPDFSGINLRYFNPIGAHPSGRIGEDPNGIPNNLLPYISKVSVGKLATLHVYGNDYDTPDGTGVRDYIHVMDLADGHIAALEYAFRARGVEAINLGTGRGYSVLEVVKAYEQASGVEIPYVIDPRRAGDIALLYADASKAKKLLGWQAKYTIEDMCTTAHRWQSQNPNGYDAAEEGNG